MRKSILITAFLFLLVTTIHAQWDGNPATVNNPVTNTTTNGGDIYSVSDGAGGMIVVWAANDGSGNNLLYVQRKSFAGQIVWGDSISPVKIFTSTDYPYIDDMVADGAGGAYIAWENESATNNYLSDVYMQHVNSIGTLLLAANGLKVNAANGDFNWFLKLDADASGVIASWTDEHDDLVNDTLINAQVFAQRYNSAGLPQWTAGGIQVSTAVGFRADNEILTDGSNGAFIAFADSRNSREDSGGVFPNVDIYAQHISSTGTRLWTNNGLPVCNQLTDQDMVNYFTNVHSMIPDGAGGFIIAFETYTDTTANTGNIYLQRLNASGNMLWTAAGVPLANATATSKVFNAMMSDAANGAVIMWQGNYTSINSDSVIYVQRITGAGSPAWGQNGVSVSAITNSSSFLLGSTMCGDGAGNYIVNWCFTDSTDFTSLLGQKYNSSGIAQWAAKGVSICINSTATPQYPYIIKSDGTNTMVGWVDYRNGNPNIYAAKISSSGALVSTSAYITTADGNWNTPATWLGNVVPPPGVDVIVKNKVTGNLTTTCNSLTVESPGSLTVNTGVKITILH